MKLRLVTVALDPETGEFPPNPLAGVEGEILSVVEHFFHHGGLPHLLLVVHHRFLSDEEKAARSGRRNRPPGVNPADELRPEDRRLFEKLREWRRGRAEADGIPVYVILNNRQLVTISSLRPPSLGDLRKIEGIGESKVGRYGRDVLRVTGEDDFVGFGERSQLCELLPRRPGNYTNLSKKSTCASSSRRAGVSVASDFSHSLGRVRHRRRERLKPLATIHRPWRDENPACSLLDFPFRARREPQQGRALQAQRQPGLSRCELNTAVVGPTAALISGPDGAASRSDPLRPGIDQTLDPCLELGGISIPPLRQGTESNRPGGGASRVAAGPFLRGRS